MFSLDKKPTLGIFSLCGCGGCCEQILACDSNFAELCDQVDIVYWQRLGLTKMPSEVDVAVIEGGVKDDSQQELLENIRSISKAVIAVGLCACGSSLCDENATESLVKPISDFVDTDFCVRGCPIDTYNFIDVLQSCIYGRNTFESSATLCGSCKTNERGCLFGREKMCSGLLTMCGCDAICTRLGRPCFGCFGVSPNANLKSVRDVAQQSLSEKDQEKYFNEFLPLCDASVFFDDEFCPRHIDVEAYIASRKCGRHSCKKTLECLSQYEEKNGIEVDANSKLLREILIEIEDARNLLTDLFVYLFSKEQRSSSIVEYISDETSGAKKYLEVRAIFNSILKKIGGRSVHPITPVAGGFSIAISRNCLMSMRDSLDTVVDFCTKCVDKANASHSTFEVGSETPVLDKVMKNWDNLTDPARFASAKVALRPPVSDKTMECVAMAVSVTDSVQKSIDNLDAILESAHD